MRYLRLTLEAGQSAVTLALHPRLTVVAGVGRAERDSIVGELLGAASGTRRGASLEVLQDDGRRVVVHRHGSDPALDRVVGSETGEDLTAEHRCADGRVDLFARAGIDLGEARRRCRFTAADLALIGQPDEVVGRLAGADQEALWAAAEALEAASADLERESAAAGTSVEDAALIEEVERRHRRFEDAQAALEKARYVSVLAGTVFAVGSVPAAVIDPPVTIGTLGATVLALVVGIVFRRRKERAARLERQMLAAAGVQSYIGFHLQRMDQLLDAQSGRRRLVEAAQAHREAEATWAVVAGDTPVGWALGNRQAITAAAERLARSTPSIDLESLGLLTAEPAELAHALVVRLGELRHAGDQGEGLPLVLDDPLVGCQPSVKQWLLELVGRSAGAPQCLYLTDDPDVAAWARIEAIADHLSLLEPTGSPA